METIQIPLESELADAYNTASAEEQQKLQLLVSLWLRDMTTPGESLAQVMDRVSDQALARGLTPEILESILDDDEE